MLATSVLIHFVPPSTVPNSVSAISTSISFTPMRSTKLRPAPLVSSALELAFNPYDLAPLLVCVLATVIAVSFPSVANLVCGEQERGLWVRGGDPEAVGGSTGGVHLRASDAIATANTVSRLSARMLPLRQLRLYQIASVHSGTKTRAEKPHVITIDLAIGLDLRPFKFLFVCRLSHFVNS
ncbi:hypothetical protein MVEN_02321900 [Mycena venus]|uniref:Uncharacterized protein n=1 Tax=Mycena venus TaxID=2733690 RepID=A0A8H6X474_9AGAR|nr:hypothetical protein MVEN_02321900 [Mycena venus]